MDGQEDEICCCCQAEYSFNICVGKLVALLWSQVYVKKLWKQAKQNFLYFCAILASKTHHKSKLMSVNAPSYSMLSPSPQWSLLGRFGGRNVILQPPVALYQPDFTTTRTAFFDETKSTSTWTLSCGVNFISEFVYELHLQKL